MGNLGRFGEYGGVFAPETLMHALQQLDNVYGSNERSRVFERTGILL